ncbi:MAG TPA: ABC transporter permease [Candidatus Cryosericum sp.]|nr:ABC transporter permease [Candidatus Cryosericum sp.]
MPDWRAYVRERLRLPGLRAEREVEIIEDLAQQLEDHYRGALERGALEAEAQAAAEREIQDWDALAREITRSDARRRLPVDQQVIERLDSTGALRRRTDAERGPTDAERRSISAKAAGMASQLLADLLHGVRLVYKSPGFTAAVLVTLALGIGANAAVFTILNAVLLRPLPYADPDRLVRIFESNPQRGWPLFSASQPNFLDWRDQSVSFDRIAASTARGLNLTVNGEAERIPGMSVSHDFFPLLGVEPALGRGFRPEEDAPGSGERVVLMTRGLWQRRFGGDPAIIGRTITLDDAPHTVIGVVPEFYWRPYELFVPLRADAAGDRSDHRLSVYGRLKPGVGLSQAEAELRGLADRLARQYADTNTGWTVSLQTFFDWTVPKESRRALHVLLGAVALVLLIACANVAGLLLARATARRREIAIRAALGASRWRLVRQLLAESILLAALGGGLGLLLAQWGLDALGVAAGSAVPRADEISLDHRVLLFTLGVSLVTGILFGLAPALQATRVDFHSTLKEGGTGGAARQRARSALVVVEVALSLVLMVGVGLLLRSLVALLDVKPGYETQNLLVARISLPEVRYPSAKEFVAFHERLRERLRGVPGVEAASTASGLPMDGNTMAMEVHVDGAGAPTDGQHPSAEWRLVAPGYFHTMGIPILRGRDLDERDLAPETRDLRGVVINEELARRLWPGQDPIGHRFHPWNAKNPSVAVVGVVGDVRLSALDETPEPAVYLNSNQGVWNPMQIVVRTQGDPSAFAGLLRGEVRALDPGVPVSQVRTMDELIDRSTASRRFTMTLLAIFASVALLLSGVGLFGLMAYLVAQRTHDIGIRMALGASKRHILGLIVGHGMLLTSLGLVAGLAAALALARLMRSLLFGVGAHDPLTLAATMLLLALVALAACCVPARRAVRVDPIVALRCE